MSNIKKNILAAVSGGILLFLQFAVAPYAPGFFFFPAAAFYVATFLPISYAIFLGLLAGSVFDSLSLLPFGAYIIGMGGGMGGASYVMRIVDERKASARGVVACVLLVAYAAFISMVYIAAGYSRHAIVAHIYDVATAVGFLFVILCSHMLLQKWAKRL